MYKKKIYILGTGGMAREALSFYKDLNKISKVHGFVEENCTRADSKILNKKIIDASDIESQDKKESIYIAAIGLPQRKKWIQELESKDCKFDTIIHPSVIKSDTADIGTGCIICPGVTLTQNIQIGQHTIININSSINHDSQIGSFVTICPGVNIGGNVKIDDECWIGIGATIIQKIRIGKNSFIGAGAVITKDVPPNTLMAGVPAKPIRKLKKSDWKDLI